MARAVFFADRALRSAAVTWLRMSSRLCLNNGMTALLNSPRNFLPGATRQVSVACSCSVHVGRPLVQHSSSTRRPPHDGKAAEPHHENKNGKASTYLLCTSLNQAKYLAVLTDRINWQIDLGGLQEKLQRTNTSGCKITCTSYCCVHAFGVLPGTVRVR